MVSGVRPGRPHTRMTAVPDPQGRLPDHAAMTRRPSQSPQQGPFAASVVRSSLPAPPPRVCESCSASSRRVRRSDPPSRARRSWCSARTCREITEMAFSESLRIEELAAGRPSGAVRVQPPALRLQGQRPRAWTTWSRATAATPATWATSSWATTGGWTGSIEPRHRDIERLRAGDRARTTARSTASTSSCSRSTAAAGNSVEFLHKVETRLRDLGYETLWGYVVADNKPARWLYSMRGYRPVRKVAPAACSPGACRWPASPQLLEARTSGAERR